MLGVIARKSFSPLLFRSFTTRVRPVPVLCDSVSGKKKEIIQSGDFLSWYSCGPTVYDSSHVGHARTYVQIDVIQRILDKRFGYNVYNALGITNIDDKIINKSKETHIPWKEIADKYESEYFSDMSKLNVQMPKSIIRVSDTIPEIIEYIRVLLDKRIAYTTKNGVYFDTQSELYSYSKLVPPSDDTATQSRISSDDEKRHLRDFALWKFTDEENYNWESPWGNGRPGWHIECSSNCNLLFGNHLNIHAGGIDLKFPHHCNEIAQCEAYHGTSEWCDTMLHVGHIFIQGRKMSKSLKNFITITDLLKDYSTDDFRMFCLLNHYSARVQLDDNGLQEAKQQWKSLHDTITILSTELQKRRMSLSSNRSCELYWMKEFGNLRQNVDSFLLDNMNTRGMIMQLQSTLSAMSKILLNDGANTPVSVFRSIVDYAVQLLKDVGFVNILTSSVEGDQQGILDTFCTFRKNIRDSCLVTLKSNESAAVLSKELLKECDHIRDTVSTNHKITMIDGKDGLLWIAGEIPKKEKKEKKKSQGLVPSLPPSELFKQSGEYSAFDERGVPTHDQNGKPLSASKLKKLNKQYNTHKAIHEKWLASQKYIVCKQTQLRI